MNIKATMSIKVPDGEVEIVLQAEIDDGYAMYQVDYFSANLHRLIGNMYPVTIVSSL